MRKDRKEGLTDKQTDMKLTVTFRSFANVPKD